MGDSVRPSHYERDSMAKIEAIVDGLPADKAICLFNVLKYYERAGKKDDGATDLAKANAYAKRLVHGRWPWECDGSI